MDIAFELADVLKNPVPVTEVNLSSIVKSEGNIIFIKQFYSRGTPMKI